MANSLLHYVYIVAISCLGDVTLKIVQCRLWSFPIQLAIDMIIANYFKTTESTAEEYHIAMYIALSIHCIVRLAKPLHNIYVWPPEVYAC